VIKEWRVFTRHQGEVKARLLVLTIKRQGQLKKLCWKILSKNSKVNRKLRNDNQYATLFFYHTVVKRTFRALVKNKLRR
jgi:hypothetical protein